MTATEFADDLDRQAADMRATGRLVLSSETVRRLHARDANGDARASANDSRRGCPHGGSCNSCGCK